jgi:hypothetical protein
MKISSLIFSILFLFSCTSGTDESDSKSENSSVSNELDSSNIVLIETLFDKDEFDDPQKEILLKELKLCSSKNRGIDDYMNPSCSPRFFELFSLSKNTPLSDAMIVQIKAKTNGFPLRRLVVFVRENGVLIKVNGFVANLIEKRITSSGFDDLLLRFNDKDQGQDVFFNCLFKWNGLSYDYHSVEVIEGPGWGGKVKSELKDSISIEVKKDILNNKMIF